MTDNFWKKKTIKTMLTKIVHTLKRYNPIAIARECDDGCPFDEVERSYSLGLGSGTK